MLLQIQLEVTVRKNPFHLVSRTNIGAGPGGRTTNSPRAVRSWSRPEEAAGESVPMFVLTQSI